MIDENFGKDVTGITGELDKKAKELRGKGDNDTCPTVALYGDQPKGIFCPGECFYKSDCRQKREKKIKAGELKKYNRTIVIEIIDAESDSPLYFCKNVETTIHFHSTLNAKQVKEVIKENVNEIVDEFFEVIKEKSL